MSFKHLMHMLLLCIASCAFNNDIHKRTPFGPEAVNYWRERNFAWNRGPSQQEVNVRTQQLRSEIERYIASNPHLTDRKKSELRSLQIRLEMTKAETQILLGPPLKTISVPKEIAERAKQYWPELKGRVDEAWDYRPYTLFFQGEVLIDIHKDAPAFQPL